MKINILGGGWYGCHIAQELMWAGYDVVLYEKSYRLFNGASGSIPARLHRGFHYPRSALTRAACERHFTRFMGMYGFLTQPVPYNIYGVAREESLVDFGTYADVCRNLPVKEVIQSPKDFPALEGALVVDERHIIVDDAREHFSALLAPLVVYNAEGPGRPADFTVDCTFCANSNEGVDRYEACITGILEGPIDTALTVMDGPFPSIYPWDEAQRLLSLTSALYTPIAKASTHYEASCVLATLGLVDADRRIELMRAQMEKFWPASRELFRPVGAKLSIRAMPLSRSDARLVYVRIRDHTAYVRAGKIDAIFDAAEAVVGAVSML